MAGALDRVLSLAVDYATERQQFGRPIARFQAIQHQLAVLAGEAAAAGRAADAAAETLGRPDFPIQVAAAKARAGEAAGIAAEIAHQVFGAMGFTHEHILHHFTRRLWAWRDEYGRESLWQEQLGARIADGGPERLWDFIVRGG
jgi:acyl-CoA dehydrogenase